MSRIIRLAIGVALGTGAFGILAYASSRVYWITIREVLQAAELVGIMDPKGSLGGQVMGHNYQRYPEWVYPVGQVVGAVVAYAPGMVVALLVLDRVGRGSWRVSVCGKCGARMKGLEGPRCAACGGEF